MKARLATILLLSFVLAAPTQKISGGGSKGGTHGPPFVSTAWGPLSFNDPTFTGMTEMGTGETIYADGAVVSHRSWSGMPFSEAAVRVNGGATMDHLRIFADRDDPFRVAGTQTLGAINITDTFMQADNSCNPPSDCHADVIQLYNPSSSTVNLTRTTLVEGLNGNGGALIAYDNTTVHFNLDHVILWSTGGGGFGLGQDASSPGASTFSLNDVCFIGFDPTNRIHIVKRVGGVTVTATQWNNVNACTIVNGAVVVGAPISCSSTSGNLDCP